jgi:hypothetical protein
MHSLDPAANFRVTRGEGSQIAPTTCIVQNPNFRCSVWQIVCVFQLINFKEMADTDEKSVG